MKFLIDKNIMGKEHPLLPYLEKSANLFNEVDFSEYTDTTEKLLSTIRHMVHYYFIDNPSLRPPELAFTSGTEEDSDFVRVQMPNQSITIKKQAA